MYGWNEKPYKAESKHQIGHDDGTVDQVYEIGQYDVTVAADGAVTYRRRYGHRSDPRQVFPNMEVADGEIRLPVNDLVGVVLSRLDPAELARALWAESQEVRESFIDCLCERWSEQGVTDLDRRTVLHRIKEAVHSAKVDHLASVMANIEYSLAKRSQFFNQIDRINRTLADYDVKDARGEPLRISYIDNDPYFKVCGTAWNEARDHWRALAMEQFAGPVAPEPDIAPTDTHELDDDLVF